MGVKGLHKVKPSKVGKEKRGETMKYIYNFVKNIATKNELELMQKSLSKEIEEGLLKSDRDTAELELITKRLEEF